MARPTTRIAHLTASEVRSIRFQMGTTVNAFQRLQPMPGVTWHQFRIAAGGGAATPAVVANIRAAWAHAVGR